MKQLFKEQIRIIILRNESVVGTLTGLASKGLKMNIYMNLNPRGAHIIILLYSYLILIVIRCYQKLNIIYSIVCMYGIGA